MSNLSIIFIIVYVLTVAIFLLMPKKAFNDLIKRDLDKDFDPAKTKGVGYYRIVILGGGITAVIITWLIKIIFY